MKSAGISKEEMLTYPEKIIDKNTVAKFKRFIEIRAKNMPVKYITNSCEFMSLDFYVDTNVLIPRADTEILVETAINEIKEKGLTKVLDICTGSGCIAVSIAKHCENELEITATDISPAAISIAKKNADKNGVSGNVTFKLNDALSQLPELEGKFDIIISNPPYIKTEDINNLSQDIKKYEPIRALDGGADGLGFYRPIASEAVKLLNPGGKSMLEIGFDQGSEVAEILKERGFSDIEIIKDLGGNDRVVTGII
jgi:release factor glutamine methyltransferase